MEFFAFLVYETKNKSAENGFFPFIPDFERLSCSLFAGKQPDLILARTLLHHCYSRTIFSLDNFEISLRKRRAIRNSIVGKFVNGEESSLFNANNVDDVSVANYHSKFEAAT